MGVEALYRKPNTSRKHDAAHKIWPCLLRNRKIDRANQVWALDTSYIPMARGLETVPSATRVALEMVY